MVRFDNGIVERDVPIFFSGVVKAVWDENPLPDGGVRVNQAVLTEYFGGGFDGGSTVLVGISSIIAHYYLMSPSKEYSPFYDKIVEKYYLLKILIEYINENTECLYEDIVEVVRNASPPNPTLPPLTEDSLLQHAQFIVNSIMDYDDAGEEDDIKLALSPAIKMLSSLAGLSLTRQRKAVNSKMREFRKKQKEKNKVTLLSLKQFIIIT